VREPRKKLSELRYARSERVPKPIRVGLVEVVADRFDEGQVRERELGIAAGAREHDASQLASLVGQLAGQPGLPDPGLARHGNEAALTAPRREQRVLEHGQLVVTPDQDGTEGVPRHRAIFAQPEGEVRAPGGADQV
jgi:hypothetical protein